MVGSIVLLVAGGAGLVAIGLLRHAWGLPARAPRLLAAAWGLLAAGHLAGAAAAGAWGVAVVALAVTLAALLLLAAAGFERARSEPERARVRTGMEPRATWAVGRRLLTFALAVPVALAASVLFGIGLRGFAGLVGTGDANGNVIALFAVPLCWTLLMMLVPMTSRRPRQVLMLGAPAALGGLLLLAGAGA